MNENHPSEMLLASSIEIEQVQSFVLNDDDEEEEAQTKEIETDNQSTSDTIIAADEIEAVLNKAESQDVAAAALIPSTVSRELEKNVSIEDPTPLSFDISLPAIIPKAVYKYANMVRESLETPRQTKLDHDVSAILGSSDPPPGFGFLHPRFYSLEQNRPTPMEPLQVWRGYHGNVYFSPIQVRRLDTDCSLSPSASFSTPSLFKAASDPLNSAAAAPEPRRVTKEKKKKKKTVEERTSNDRLIEKKRTDTRTTTDAKQTTEKNKLKTKTSVPLIDGRDKKHDLQQESSKMWQSVVTCAPVRVKPISKRSQHAIEDMHALQQEQSLLDPTGYHRQVLPNIRPIAKSKFVYKGLAYKESKKLPGLNSSTSPDNDGDALQKPLIAYNLAQAYARYEIDAARAKQSFRPPPPSAVTAAPSKIHHPTQMQTSLDLRETRKRLARGTTLSYRPPAQSVVWTPGRGDLRSTLASEVLVPVQKSSTLTRASSSSSPRFSHYYHQPQHQHQEYITVHTTPNLSQHFDSSLSATTVNI